MSAQPEALRLAECLEAYEAVEYDAAAELRRLYDANVELLKALEAIVDDKTPWGNLAASMANTARAAIAKHGGAA